MYHPSDIDHLNALKAQANAGADFARLARDNSELSTGSLGGDIGWIAKGELSETLANAIFAAPVGKASEVTTIPGDGSYLFKVSAEETRTPSARQLDGLTSTAFSKWYDAKKSAALITRDESITNPTS
jgi:parvulin-like peptidyl-prolyl isomerase